MSIKTKFGTAIIGNHGYYHISSIKEGNVKKLLHRLIFEDFYQTKIPKNIVIHHEDGNKLNNEIWNLVPMTLEEHNKLHAENMSDDHKRKLSESGKNRKLKLTHKMNISSSNNTTGIYRVSIRKINGKLYCRYMYLMNNKRKEITAKSLCQLKEKVLKRNLEWIILDEEKARETIKMME